MKKISILLAALMGMALIVGCSNDSDSGSGYFGPVLPASSGQNEFVGKTFSEGDEDSKTTIAFDVTTGVMTGEQKIPAEVGINTAYTLKTVDHFSYSYNSDTKSLYMLTTSSDIYIVRDGVETRYTNYDKMPVVSDAKFAEEVKQIAKIVYNQADDAYLNGKVKEARLNFKRYGYTDNTGTAELSPEVIAKYTEGLYYEKELIEIKAYEISGNTLKFVEDDRVPYGFRLHQIYGCFELPIVIVGDNCYSALTACTDPYKTPNIMIYADSVSYEPVSGWRVSQLAANAIYADKKASYSSANEGVWTYTAEPKIFSYEEISNQLGTSIVIDDLGITAFEYASSENIPSFSNPDDVYTLVQ